MENITYDKEEWFNFLLTKDREVNFNRLNIPQRIAPFCRGFMLFPVAINSDGKEILAMSRKAKSVEEVIEFIKTHEDDIYIYDVGVYEIGYEYNVIVKFGSLSKDNKS